jgi:hypothetical protein
MLEVEVMRVITLVGVLFVMFLGVVFGVLCATSGTPVDMKGTIVGICTNSSQPTCDMPDSMLVEGVLTSGNQKGNVSIKITNETQIFRKNGDNSVQSSCVDLKLGESVEIRFIGPVTSSYPPEVTASNVTIVG